MAVKSQVKNPKSCFALLCFLLVSCDFVTLCPCYAQPVSSTELIDNARLYDGAQVTYAGEVIGGWLRRGANARVNVNDGKNAIECWVPLALSATIRFSGNYKTTGDRIEVSGIFHRACPEHGGDPDIHAQNLRTLKSGKVRQEHLNLEKRNLAVFLLGVLCLVMILSQLKRK